MTWSVPTRRPISSSPRTGTARPVRKRFTSKAPSPSSVTWRTKATCPSFAAADQAIALWEGDEGVGFVPGALSYLRADIVAAFGLFDLDRHSWRQAQGLGDIVVPAVHVGTELDRRPVPERRLINQPDRDRSLELDKLLVVLAHRLLELVENALLLGQAGREFHRVLDTDAAVAAVTLGQREQRLGRRVVEVDRLLVVHVELDQPKGVFWPRQLDPLAVLLNVAIVGQPARALGR